MYLLENNVKVLQKMLVPQDVLNAHSVDQHHPEDPRSKLATFQKSFKGNKMRPPRLVDTKNPLRPSVERECDVTKPFV